jgi:hypothetical protein
VKEDNGEIYHYQKAVSALPGLGGLPVSNYAAVKLPDKHGDGGRSRACGTRSSTMSICP